MREPIEFNFENQKGQIDQLRKSTEAGEANLERLAEVIALADLNLEAAIAAAKSNAEALVKAFRESSEEAVEARSRSFDIIKGIRSTLQDDLRGQSFEMSGEIYARQSTDVPVSSVLDPVKIELPGVIAKVLSVEVPLGSDLRGYFANYFYYSRVEHEGYDANNGTDLSLPKNPVHERMYHRTSGRDFMFEIDPFVVLELDQISRQDAGIAPWDINREDTIPVLAHLSRIALTPLR